MAEPMRAGALERDPSFVVAATYDRTIEASIDAIWENVLDWEHFPYVHEGIFESVDLVAQGPWGFRANLGIAGGSTSLLETAIDRDARHYVARTCAPSGTLGENWTTLDPMTPDRTGVHVEFCLPPAAHEDVGRIGELLRRTYAVLWDQDEAMMQLRERALSAAPPEPSPPPLPLGEWQSLRTALPRDVVFGGRRFRIAAPGDEPIVYALECPHRLAPLDACPIEEGIVICPWHGYRFDVASGRSADGRGLRMRPPPLLEIDATGGARLIAAGGD